MSLTIAFVGFGEVGQLIARQLMQQGNVVVAVDGGPTAPRVSEHAT